MLDQLTQLMTAAKVMVNPEVDPTSDEVLAHCPYHPQINFYRAARDSFIEQQGLADLQEFVVRDTIIGHKKAVAIEELIYREDMKMMWNGAYRIVHCLIDYFDLYTKLIDSDNFSTEWDRLHQINPMEFGMHAWQTWTQVTQLWMEGEHAAAGKAFAVGMFPIKQDKESNVNWGPLPFEDPEPGEEIAGYVSGSIKKLVKKSNHDDLASCLQNQDELLTAFHESADSIMKRYNDDIEDGIAHLHVFYQSLNSAAANCQDTTKSHIKMINDSLKEVNAETIIANLAEKKNHVELAMVNMKMNAGIHEYHDYGMNLADIYLTLTSE